MIHSQICSLFVSFTESQNNSVNDLLKIDFIRNRDNYLITSTKLLPSRIDPDNVFIYPKLNGVCDVIKESLSRLYKKKLLLFILKVKSNYNVIEIFIPHFINFISNYIIVNREILFKNKRIIVSIYPDGIALYYHLVVSIRGGWNSTLFLIIRRYISGLVLGINYRPFFGSIIDPFNLIDNIYTPLPELTIKYSEKKIIFIPTEKKDLNGRNILILSGTKKIDSIKNFRKLVKYLAIFQDSYSEIYFKPHPSITIKNYNTFLKQIESPIKLLHLRQPVEDLIERYRFSYIISYKSFSSALINLKVMYGNNIVCAIWGFDYINKICSKQIKIDFLNLCKTVGIKLISSKNK